MLTKENIHRLGNILVPMDSYGPLIEEKMQSFLEEEYNNGTREMSTEDICKMIGSHLGEDSFLYWASKNDIKVIVPGIVDGAVGSQIWMFTQKHADFKLNITKDADTLSGIIFKGKKIWCINAWRRNFKTPYIMVEPIQRWFRFRCVHYHSTRI